MCHRQRYMFRSLKKVVKFSFYTWLNVNIIYFLTISLGSIATTFPDIFISDYQKIEMSVLELFEPTSTSPRPPSPTPEECDCPTEGPIDGAGLVKPSLVLLYLIVLYII